MKIIFKGNGYLNNFNSIIRHVESGIYQQKLEKDRRFFFNIKCNDYSVEFISKRGKIKKIIIISQ